MGQAAELLKRAERRAFLLRKRLGAPRGAARRLIVVAGVQRSGTNMLMDLLEASDRTDVVHERDPRLYADYMMQGDDVVAGLISDSAMPVMVIKALHEPERVRPLMDRFAPGMAVWLFRHWDDTVNSNRRSWPEGRNRIDDIVKDPKLGGWRSAPMPADTLAELRRVHRPDMNQDTAQALFYWHRNKLVFDLGLADDPRVIICDYDAMLANPARELPRLCNFLDLPLTPRMAAVPDPGAVRKRPPPAIEPQVAAMCARLYERMRERAGATAAAAAA